MFDLASLVIDQLLIYDMCFCINDIKSFIANGKLSKIALDYFIKKTEHNEQTYMTQFIKNKTKNDRMSELEPFLSKLSFPDQMEKMKACDVFKTEYLNVPVIKIKGEK